MNKCLWWRPTVFTEKGNGNVDWLGNQCLVLLQRRKFLSMSFRCPYCTACKSKQDPQRPVEHQAEERRAYPSIQSEYCFSKAEGSDSLTTVLVAIDCQSKMIPFLQWNPTSRDKQKIWFALLWLSTTWIRLSLSAMLSQQ